MVIQILHWKESHKWIVIIVDGNYGNYKSHVAKVGTNFNNLVSSSSMFLYRQKNAFSYRQCVKWILHLPQSIREIEKFKQKSESKRILCDCKLNNMNWQSLGRQNVCTLMCEMLSLHKWLCSKLANDQFSNVVNVF